MSKLVGILFCLALVELCYGLECYNCSPDNKFCEDFNTDQIKTIKCGNVVGDHKPSCLKQVLKNSRTGQVNVTRKCIITPSNGNIDNECLPPSGWEKVECLSCNTDGCNSAPITNLNLFSLFGAIAACVFVKFVLH